MLFVKHKRHTRSLLNMMALSLCGIAPLAHAQIGGVGLQSMVGTGYGLYVVTMRPSDQNGAISSFYLYSHSGVWPSRWHEIDIEFTPGFVGTGKIEDPFRPHVLAQGHCYNDAVGSDNLPTNKTDCQLSPVPLGVTHNAYVSLNVYSHRAWGGYRSDTVPGLVYPHSENQVFLESNNSEAIYQSLHTYAFYYTPNGIYWTKDLPVIALAKDQRPPTRLLQSPIAFAKKDSKVVNANRYWSPHDHAIDQVPGTVVKAPDFPVNEAFVYDNVPLTTKLEGTNQLSDSGTLMFMSMNLWDGSCQNCGSDPWGGPVSPTPRVAASEYQQVAFYPLETPVDVAAKALDPTRLAYAKPKIYSDFSKGVFLIDQKNVTFSTLWQVSNGIYIYPLGVLDERNLRCGHGTLKMSFQNYPQPRVTTDISGLKACPWLA